MSGVSDSSPARRRLTGKRAATVRRLSEATVHALREVPLAELTFQEVAGRAGVTRATAYVYFSSKEHLIAEVYWRRLIETPQPDLEGVDVVGRVVITLRHLAVLVADEPEFGKAAAHALLSEDPDVEELRIRVSNEIRSMLASALGPDARPRLLELLELVYTGAIMRAGTGHLSYAQVADELEHAARVILASPAALAD